MGLLLRDEEEEVNVEGAFRWEDFAYGVAVQRPDDCGDSSGREEVEVVGGSGRRLGHRAGEILWHFIERPRTADDYEDTCCVGPPEHFNIVHAGRTVNLRAIVRGICRELDKARRPWIEVYFQIIGLEVTYRLAYLLPLGIGETKARDWGWVLVLLGMYGGRCRGGYRSHCQYKYSCSYQSIHKKAVSSGPTLYNIFLIPESVFCKSEHLDSSRVPSHRSQ